MSPNRHDLDDRDDLDDLDDRELHQHFERLRQEDERLARPFSVVTELARPAPRARAAGHRRLRLAAAALSVALLIGAGALRWPRFRRVEPPLALLSHWRAPTDSLLEAPESELLRSVPRLGAPLLSDNTLDPDNARLLRRP
jgi:hypothetical protein